MRVASYNQMFGCNGRSLSESLRVHTLHKIKSHGAVARRANLERTAETIRESNADIVAIAEVLSDRQRQGLIAVLKPLGYRHFHVGRGHGLGQKYGGALETLLATRMPSDLVYTPDFQVPDAFGYGSGVVGIHVPDYDLHVIQVHLPLCNKKTQDSFLEQVGSVLQEVERIKEGNSNARIVIMGDFNYSHNDLIRLHPEFTKFKKLSASVATCSTTNLLKWFYRKDLDHILGVDLEAKGAGVLDGISDHKLVWVDL